MMTPILFILVILFQIYDINGGMCTYFDALNERIGTCTKSNTMFYVKVPSP